jgi:hypothetical protein
MELPNVWEQLEVTRHAQTALSYLEDISTLRWLNPRPSVLNSRTLSLLAALKQEFHLAEIDCICQLGRQTEEPKRVRMSINSSSVSWVELEDQHAHLSPVDLLADTRTLVQQLTGLDPSADYTLVLIQEQLERAAQRCHVLESKARLSVNPAPAEELVQEQGAIWVDPHTWEPPERGTTQTDDICVCPENTQLTASHMDLLEHHQLPERLNRHRAVYLQEMAPHQVPAIQEFLNTCLQAISNLRRCGQDYQVLRSNLLDTLSQHLPYLLPAPASLDQHQLLLGAEQDQEEGFTQFHKRVLQMWIADYPFRHPDSNAVLLYLGGLQKEFQRRYPSVSIEFSLPHTYSAALIKVLNIQRMLEAMKPYRLLNDKVRTLRLITQKEKEELTIMARTGLNASTSSLIHKATYCLGLLN